MLDAPDFQKTVVLNSTPSFVMPTADSPDWQETVQLVNSPHSDAPDWQQYIVGPGGVPIVPPTPTPALPVIVQKASAISSQDSSSSITATFASTPTPGNQIIALFGENANYPVTGPLPPSAPPPLGWTCLGSEDGINTTATANSERLQAYQHTVQIGDGKSWTFPTWTATAAWMAALALYEVTPSGPVSCVGLGNPNVGSGVQAMYGPPAYSSTSALGTLGLGAGMCVGAAANPSAIALLSTGTFPNNTWSDDLYLYDSSGTLYGDMDTCVAPALPASTLCQIAFDYTGVNSSNSIGMLLMLLIPPT
jgi:hypothetical protein